MDGTRWKQVQSLFHLLADLSKSEQRARLEAACGGDSGLMAEVLAMLEEDARGSSLLDRGVAHVAHQIVDPAVIPSLNDIGPYRVTRILGQGGMGVVYLAEREDLRILVAIKILRDAWLSPVRRERFRSEQRTLAQLNHPFIAKIYDADTLPDGTPWFAMEYVEGIPLTDYCWIRPSSVRERLELFRSVCEAVQHAHGQAVIHRDLKPSNILVKSGGDVRLLDFGIAKQLDGLDTPINETRTGLHVMTPAYAAPEQVLGGRVGVYTDVYALGVILYELLSGRLPYDLSNCTPGEIGSAIASAEPEKPSAAARRTALIPGHALRVPAAGKASWADLDVLCLTAMHKDPQRRYRSGEALIRDIGHFLEGEPLEARPDTLRYRAGKFVRRQHRAFTVTAAVLMLVVGLVAFFAARLARARSTTLAEAARTQRIQHFMLNLFQGGDQAAGPADNLRVVTLLDRGVAEARALDREPEIQAELYQTLGSMYQKLGKFDRADALLGTALERNRAIYGAEGRQAAASEVALGLLRIDQARLPEAERLIRNGLARSRRILPAGHAAVARALAALGSVLEHRGQYPKAIPVLEEAIRMQSVPGAILPDLAESLSELANVQFYTGNYAASDSLNQRVIKMHREIYGGRHPLVAGDLINLSAIQLNLGNYAQAEDFARQALDINRSWYGDVHPETAAGLTFVGQALVRQDRYDEAHEVLSKALSIQEQIYGKVHPRVATTLSELAAVFMKSGRLDEAEAGFRRAADIYRAAYGDRHYTVAIALSNLASVYLERKAYSRAEQLFRDVIRRYAESLSPDHLNTGIAQIKLGRALVRQERYREAEAHSLAGYAILMKQTTASVSWLKTAREDLAAEYQALGQPDKAGKFQGREVNPREFRLIPPGGGKPL